jgi:hypothetical protein
MLLLQVIFSSKCLSVTNLLCLLINMVLFAAVGAFGFLAPQYAPTVRTMGCGIGSAFDMLYQTPKGLPSPLVADMEFCSTNCVCKGTNTAWVGTAYASHAVSGGFSAGSSIIKYADCTTTAANTWKTVTTQPPMGVIIPFITQGEDLFSCSGVCEFTWFYIFSDVSKGLPKKACIDAMIGTITDNATTIMIVGAGLVLSQLLGLIGSFMICCSPSSECCGTLCIDPKEKEKREKDLKEKEAQANQLSLGAFAIFGPQTKAVRSQVTTPMLVVIPQA